MAHIHDARWWVRCSILLGLLILGACAPRTGPSDARLAAIQEIQKSLELPEAPVEFIENGHMINSPSGDLEVAVYQDSEGRVFSVHLASNRVVEIDARNLLENLPADAPSLTLEALREKAMRFFAATIPNFERLKSTWQYEEGQKGDNYFFNWYAPMQAGDLNRPFAQIALHKSGLLFAFYNTLSLNE